MRERDDVFAGRLTDTRERITKDHWRKLYMDRLKLYRERFRVLAEALESLADDTGYIEEARQQAHQMAVYARVASEVGIEAQTTGAPF
jgi:hypothetical protein